MVRADIFIKAGIITAVLLVTSLLVGNYVEGMAYTKMSDALLKINENSEAIFIMQAYLQENDTRACRMLEQQIDTINADIYSLRGQVEAQKSTSVLKDYNSIRREYFLSNARLLSLTKQYLKLCNSNDKIVLFFYSAEKECPECYAQGRILDDVRVRCSNIKVFSFPTDVDMPMIKSFMAFYGVSKPPSVVVDLQGQDVVLEKVSSANEIIAIAGC
ncbi:MAG: hypothetical protein N3G76_03105 [Candidatus Micrarchaeota archaeon]|nr:hypothetical protein [Candidatus Micrarchaeota archaeon]